MANTYTIENITPEKLAVGMSKLTRSGFTVENDRVKGMGVEATYLLADTTLNITIEKQPPFLGNMIESQIRSFFA